MGNKNSSNNSTKKKFSIDKIPNQAGRCFFITGGNTGLGKETAIQLAKKNADIIIACRNKEKALKAKEDIDARGSGRVEFIGLDLSDFVSIRNVIPQLNRLNMQIHVLINNAGVMMCDFSTTKQGHELQFGVNHLGHYLLTQLLMPKLIRTARPENPGRIVNLTSIYHSKGPSCGFMIDNLMWEAEKGQAYDKSLAYGHSKFCNVVFTQSLALKLELRELPIYCNCVHPGMVTTDLYRHVEKSFKKRAALSVLKTFSALNVHDGALTQLYVSVMGNTKGQYYSPIAQLTDLEKNCPTIDDEVRENLWRYSAEVTGYDFFEGFENTL